MPSMLARRRYRREPRVIAQRVLPLATNTRAVLLLEHDGRGEVGQGHVESLFQAAARILFKPSRDSLLRDSFMKRDPWSFEVGDVFNIIHTELSGPDWDLSRPGFVQGPFGTVLYAKTRPVVLVRKDFPKLVVLPITTNSGRGADKSYANSLAFGGIKDASSGEVIPYTRLWSVNLLFTPPEHTFPKHEFQWDNRSQINYASPITIDVDDRVEYLGHLAPNSCSILVEQFLETMSQHSPFGSLYRDTVGAYRQAPGSDAAQYMQHRGRHGFLGQ